jgi:hypothetical protein
VQNEKKDLPERNAGTQGQKIFVPLAAAVDDMAPIYHSKRDSTMSFLVKHLTFFVTVKCDRF